MILYFEGDSPALYRVVCGEHRMIEESDSVQDGEDEKVLPVTEVRVHAVRGIKPKIGRI